MGCACVSNVDDFVDNSVTADRSAGIDGVHVVDAAANSELFDNPDAHVGG